MSAAPFSRRNFGPRGGSFQKRPPANPPPPAPPAKPAARKAPKIEGDAALWVPLQRATDPNTGWTKTTRAMETPYGVVLNVCSRKAGSASATEALCFVPSAKIDRAAGKLVPLQ